ncbi:MAG: 23S rRNA (pseudouridine(1915)-N(3))-methyltransferase RlmH [Clostridiales bacterium]|nr:23S rRNA (pseudouridine(1915)-N(3))-methyltransferase RlmH [Clostridiales bacterium]
MRINILAIGKLKEEGFISSQAEYLKRLSKFSKAQVFELPEAPFSKREAEQQKIESESLFTKAKGTVVIFDRRGDELSSEELARYIEVKKVSGESEISFLIGGSHGFSAEALKKADKVISFSKMTFPHQLFRVMALEQIYRAFTIIEGLPYHK